MTMRLGETYLTDAAARRQSMYLRRANTARSSTPTRTTPCVSSSILSGNIRGYVLQRRVAQSASANKERKSLERDSERDQEGEARGATRVELGVGVGESVAATDTGVDADDDGACL